MSKVCQAPSMLPPLSIDLPKGNQQPVDEQKKICLSIVEDWPQTFASPMYSSCSQSFAESANSSYW
jgi:hypothetical protein